MRASFSFATTSWSPTAHQVSSRKVYSWLSPRRTVTGVVLLSFEIIISLFDVSCIALYQQHRPLLAALVAAGRSPGCSHGVPLGQSQGVIRYWTGERTNRTLIIHKTGAMFARRGTKHSFSRSPQNTFLLDSMNAVHTSNIQYLRGHRNRSLYVCVMQIHGHHPSYITRLIQ